MSEQSINLMTYYFTFGSNHEDRNGISLGRSFLPIMAEHEDCARQKMIELREDKWSFCYPSKEAAGVRRHNLREITEFEADTRERRKEQRIEDVVATQRQKLLLRLEGLDRLKEIMRKLPTRLIEKCREYDGQLDIDNLTREESVEALGSLGAGRWRKEVNTAYDGTLDYYGEVDGIKVRLWAAGAPETCRVVEVEEVIPEQRVIRRKLICQPA